MFFKMNKTLGYIVGAGIAAYMALAPMKLQAQDKNPYDYPENYFTLKVKVLNEGYDANKDYLFSGITLPDSTLRIFHAMPPPGQYKKLDLLINKGDEIELKIKKIDGQNVKPTTPNNKEYMIGLDELVSVNGIKIKK